MKKIVITLAVCLGVWVQHSYAQNEQSVHLTVEDAIQIGLQHNFGILIAENEADIARLNRTLGNAGFLPTLQLSGSREQIYETESETRENMPEESEDFEVTLLSADLELGWTLFDGGRMFVTWRRLDELRNLGETLAQIQVENTVRNIISEYYDIVREQKLLDVLMSSVEISEERFNIAQTKRDLGSGTEFELLLARSDLNTDIGEVLRQEVVVNSANMDLIRILDLDTDADFTVENDIVMLEFIELADILPLFFENNRPMEAARQRVQISELELKEIRRERFPQLDLNMGYTYNHEEIRNALILQGQTDGYYVGLTARINLFDGFNTNRRVQIAKIEQRNAEIQLDEDFKFLETALYAEYRNYTSVLRLVELESENLQLAVDALEIALEQFRLATITSVELREAQNILINTESRLIDAQFDAKISETELLRLAGELPPFGEDQL